MKISVSLPDELVERIDAVRGDVSRSRWLRRAVEQALGESSDRRHVADPRPSSAPAEQPQRPGRVEAEVLRRLQEAEDAHPMPPLSGVDRAAAFRRATEKKR